MTAAPGPQQPDEVRCDCWYRTQRPGDVGVGEWHAVTCPQYRPAAPSAQPDEDEQDGQSGHDGTGEPCTSCGVRGGHWDDCPRYSYAALAAAADRTHAQPVRDTEEGRR